MEHCSFLYNRHSPKTPGEVSISINGSLTSSSQKSEYVSTRHTALPCVQSIAQSVPSKRTAVPTGWGNGALEATSTLRLMDVVCKRLDFRPSNRRNG